MDVAIRVDASITIGTGHFMRCLTLADALVQRGARTRFVSRHLPEHLRALLPRRGHQFIALADATDSGRTDELAHAAWLGASQEDDARQSADALSDRIWDWLVVDHYALDARWESALREAAKKILAIDDIADRVHDCDLLLDQNCHADMERRYAGKLPPPCRTLLGPRYALLREEFRRMRDSSRRRRAAVKRLLVCFGGIDATNCTGLAMDALADFGDFQVDVVIGAQHPCRADIEARCAARGYRCHVETGDMAALMAAADLALGAAGATSWERCCLGLPALTISLAANQDDVAQGLALSGASRHLGMLKTVDAELIKAAIRDFLQDGNKLADCSEAAYRQVDGHGTERVCTCMLGEDDADDL